jgi:hypothetical protein
MEALNYADGVFIDAFRQVQIFQLSSTGTNETFNLLDLAVHDTIEMDGSLTRNDIYLGDDVSDSSCKSFNSKTEKWTGTL